MIRIGFTGSQGGMTPEQKDRLRGFLTYAMATCGDVEFNHGNCIGSDTEASWIAYEVGCDVHAYPCDIISKWGNAYYGTIWDAHDPPPPMERNETLASFDLLVGAPEQNEEIRRSGTWATVRRARKRATPVYILWPDGSVLLEDRG